MRLQRMELTYQEEDSDIDSAIREKLSKHQCNYCSRPIPAECYQPQKEVDARLCLDCYHKVGLIAGHSSLDFIKENSTKDYGDLDGDSWSDHETLLLLEGMQLYNENWNKIAEHVGSKSKAQCILHFVRLPLDGAPLDNIDVPSTSGSSNLSNDDDHGRSEPISNGGRH
ncbi:SWI/SNF complex subunit SWI3C-like [Salvia divinorum]|uniref:SWI/SNF complex subunit SWI3C-like n=1 Tax=Salvia divinorum TaxID=28513 RepID=A0ABD1FTS9_SALDI